ncbi:MAG TPA: aspartate-semialdehyde dehydrogenase [Candidatus Eisenbacteria bacterium]|nr:aspartate-semialdehyde dehydrogenase [Candidatus Eisenbacteria bacterium]
MAVLGATGTVGQRFIQLLENHPWFEVAEVLASDQSAGKPYAEAVGSRWKLPSAIPAAVRRLTVKKPGDPLRSKILFSSLDASVAGEVETHYAKTGHFVSSNARNHRMAPDVPLVIPEVNRDHLALLDRQHLKGGGIVTNPNCSTIVLAMALAPLHRAFGIEQVLVTTFQAASGAGYPGVPSLDILGNVVPYIAGEEAKMESETHKILGRLGAKGIEPAEFAVSAHCHRVAVLDGHLEAISVKFKRRPTRKQILAAFEAFRPLAKLGLPSAPEEPIVVREEDDRPQPRLDADRAGGMGVTLGRLRTCSVLDWKFDALGHNVVRGAAGAAILNAEILAREARF